MNPLGNLKINKSNIVEANNEFIFDKYMCEINKFQPLSREEEVKLFKQIEKNRNPEAIEKICKHNLLFVVSVAKKFAKAISTSSLTLEDLINEGNIGLYTAINSFDYRTGNKFISYAVWLIQNEIIKCIQVNIKTIRIPQSVIISAKLINKKEAYLEQKLIRSPTNSEIFDAIIEDKNIKFIGDLNRVNEVKEAFNFEKSLNAHVNVGNKSVEYVELFRSKEITPLQNILENERNDLIIRILNTLPVNIKNYFIDYFGLFGNIQLNLTDMGEKYGELSQTIKNRMDKYLKIISDNKSIKNLIN